MEGPETVHVLGEKIWVDCQEQKSFEKKSDVFIKDSKLSKFLVISILCLTGPEFLKEFSIFCESGY